EIERAYPQTEVKRHLQDVVEDLIDRRLENLEEIAGQVDRYRMNVVLEHEPGTACPTVVENTPTLANLIGGIDQRFVDDEVKPPDHMSIRGGSILQADGGYLVLDARDVLSEPGAWKVLVRTLRTGKLEITDTEVGPFVRLTPIKPQPIDIQVKVILIGDPGVYYLLDQFDPDFPQLFKVLAEFDTVIPRDKTGLDQYAAVIARIAKDDDLLPFDRTAVAALAEHGARIAATRNKLSARFSRLADIARESSFLARRNQQATVNGDNVRETVRRTKRRADLTSRKFREHLANGTIRVETSGSAVGQINGLAVVSAGPITYGFPARITASIGPGSSGVINIERESALSGAIHTKGFFILSGLLRNLLKTDHPLTFDASIAFEQSYGGIDGDSASGAEICCLLSALTEIPIRQSLAMTGAIDQMGSILAIGGVNEKIEGFFDVCRDIGMSGEQGVIIPRANADELMLRHDVVEACSRGEFAVYPVDNVLEALDILLERSGEDYASLLDIARTRAREYWEMTRQFRPEAAAKHDLPATRAAAAREPA
ncbi:MAG: Lon protease family protein, partial [Phycisphaerales bacterium]